MLIDATTGYVAPKAIRSAKSDFAKQEAARQTAKNIRFAAFVMLAAAALCSC